MLPNTSHRMTTLAACFSLPLLMLLSGNVQAQEASGTPETEAPATEAPATEAPAATETPATEAPATEAPATEAPETEAPATEAANETPAEEDGEMDFADDGGGFEDGGGSDEPGIGERRLVAYVATGVAAAALVTGGVFAFLAWQQHQCVADVIECNKTLDDPIVGEELFDARAEIEYKALAADMAFLFGAASALVAATGYIRGFVFTGENDGAPLGDEVTLRGLPPLPRVAATSVSISEGSSK